MQGRASRMKAMNPTFSALGTTIFTEMSALAAQHGAINLGQGFPDGEGPELLRQKAADALLSGPNQYPPMPGLPDLRKAVAEHNARFYGLDIDPETEVLVTSGATEALADCLFGLLAPGDEAVILEPAYDSYRPIIEAAGAVCVPVALDPPEWTLDAGKLEAAFSSRTKLIVLNTPLNPCGKVFTTGELDLVAKLLKRHDAFAVCDEVYEHLIFDGAKHEPLMVREGMRDRCLRIGSAGKTFSLTGWKVGYITASPALLRLASKTHQFITFTTPPALQSAVAFGLRLDDAYFEGLARDLERKRDRLSDGLANTGFTVLPCAGTYFLACDISPLETGWDDKVFCRKITQEAGVAAVPVSAFYSRQDIEPPRNYVRFCFCKEDDVLDDAIKRLSAYFERGR